MEAPEKPSETLLSDLEGISARLDALEAEIRAKNAFIRAAEPFLTAAIPQVQMLQHRADWTLTPIVPTLGQCRALVEAAKGL